MRLLLATNHLGLGGSESYLLTVAEQLDRLGHEVTIFTPEPGGGVPVALERGLPVVDEPNLPDECDAALVQDGGVSHLLSDRYPEAPQLFVAHSETFDLQAPPQLDGAVAAIVVLNDRVAARMRSFAVKVEIVRLRQPIDVARFAPGPPLPETPRRALLLSNNPKEDRIGMLEAACEGADLELVKIGGVSGHASDTRPPLVDADLVIGYGRSILEAMSCSRAAYVYDFSGGDGWVTTESYPAIEADGIAGRSGRSALDARALAEDLRRFDPSMGPVNHDLVVAHHRANLHAQELVEIFRRLASPPPRPRGPLLEMSRLVRLEWRARFEAGGLLHENGRLREQLRRSEETVQRERLQAEERMRDLQRTYERSASWRLTAPLRALTSSFRRLSRRRRPG
jgi:hypothetical protein